LPCLTSIIVVVSLNRICISICRYTHTRYRVRSNQREIPTVTTSSPSFAKSLLFLLLLEMLLLYYLFGLPSWLLAGSYRFESSPTQEYSYCNICCCFCLNVQVCNCNFIVLLLSSLYVSVVNRIFPSMLLLLFLLMFVLIS